MKKSIKKNYIYNLLYQMMVLILPLITTPYISRVIGVVGIGIYSYTISISAIFILFGSLGISLYGQREIAYIQEQKEKRTKIFWEIFILRLTTTLIALLIYWLMFVVREQEYSFYYKILAIEIIASIFDISWFFMGLEEFKKTVIRNMLVKMISVLLIFVFVKSKEDLVLYYYIYVFSIILGNISLWIYLPKYIEKISVKSLNIIRHIRPVVSLFIPQIAIQIYTILDKTMIGSIIEDKSEVGYYDQAQKIIKMTLSIISALGTVMMPRIASTYAKGEKNKVKNYMNKSFNLVFFLAFPLIFGINVIADNFVPWFLGNGYGKVVLLMKIISPIILFIGLSTVTGTQYLLPLKRQKEFTLSVILGSVINICFNFLLIGKFKSIGASIGTVIAELSVTLVQIYFTRNDFEWEKIIKMAFNYFLAGIIMTIICALFGNIINRNLEKMLLQIIIGSITYIMTLFILKDKFLLEIIKKLKINNKQQAIDKKN